jgi:hypothetical protein
MSDNYETDHDRTVAEAEERLARMGLMDDEAGLNALQRAEEVARRRAQREAERAAATAETTAELVEQPVYRQAAYQKDEYHSLPIHQRPGAFSLSERVYQEERERQRWLRYGGRKMGGAKSWFN